MDQRQLIGQVKDMRAEQSQRGCALINRMDEFGEQLQHTMDVVQGMRREQVEQSESLASAAVQLRLVQS